jgi:hypothetical protein
MTVDLVVRISCADCGATIVTTPDTPEWILFFCDHFRTEVEPLMSSGEPAAKLAVHSWRPVR